MNERWGYTDGGEAALVFERSHLQQYVDQNLQLEREIVDLFLLQLPDIVNNLKASSDPKDWKLWSHTLKGSAMSIGARKIERAAIELEAAGFEHDSPARREKLAQLEGLAAEFASLARRIFN